MAVAKIRDEIEMMAYFETFTQTIDGLGHVVYVDADEDVQKRVETFLSNTRLTGMAMFVGIYDGDTDMDEHKSGYLFTGTMSVLKQTSNKTSLAMQEIRKATRECLLNCLGKIHLDSDETRQNDFENYWEFRREDKRFLPSGEMGNSAAYGFTINFEIYIEAGAVIYKNLA